MSVDAAGQPSVLGRAETRRLLEAVLAQSGADETEVLFNCERGSLTRFAANAVHQHVTDDTPSLTVRSVFGKRVGSATTTRLEPQGITQIVEQSETLARLAPERPGFPGLPEPAGDAPEAEYSASTFFAGPALRVAMAGIACGMAREAGLEASGSIGTMGQELAVANSHGIFAYTLRSTARMNVVMVGERGSGHGQAHALDVASIDAEQVARRAVEIGRRAQNPVNAPPGEYTVVLQPGAVSDITQWLAFMGFGAQAVDEKRSFVSGKRGEQVLGENITIWDDGLDRAALPLPFDFEGVPRQRLSLIQRGVAGDIALDSYFARKLGMPNNGHARPSGGVFNVGPVPIHMHLAAGSSSFDDLVRTTDRGLLVTAFHYTRVVHPLHLIVTGMTRHGTFLIEHGEVTRPVKNLRYTQSYVEALKNVQAIGDEVRLVGEMLPARVPALKIGKFTFTGVTE